MKTVFAALSFLAVAAFAAPSYSMDMMACSEENLMKVERDAKAMTDMTHMDMAMKEVEMAKMSMKDGKTDDCAVHLDNAMKQTMMK